MPGERIAIIIIIINHDNSRLQVFQLIVLSICHVIAPCRVIAPCCVVAPCCVIAPCHGIACLQYNVACGCDCRLLVDAVTAVGLQSMKSHLLQWPAAQHLEGQSGAAWRW